MDALQAKGIELIHKFLSDYQFDKEDEGYLGFLNVGVDLLNEEDAETFEYICDNPDVFEPIIDECGGDTEDGLHKEETVFILK